MSDITSAFNGLLKQREAPAASGSYNVEAIDDFLKEAQRINAHITTLHTELLSVRQAYLSTAQPRKTPALATRGGSRPPPPQTLTDRQREDIDANAKTLLRELNASIRALSDAEQLRRETETALIRKRFAPRLGRALGAWAGGSGGGDGSDNSNKGADQVAAEDGAAQVAAHREAVLWFLRQRLQRCGQTQRDMMEVRLTREVEKNRSVLAKAGGPSYADFAASMGRDGGGASSSTASLDRMGSGGVVRLQAGRAAMDEEERDRRAARPADLTEAEIQMFEKGNQDMLKHYETTLDKVRTAEKSLIEISELQTLLVGNLETQSANIDQLVADSFNTAENVGGGNKQLKKAAQRGSPARYTFFAASGLCLFLIVWDLII